MCRSLNQKTPVGIGPVRTTYSAPFTDTIYNSLILPVQFQYDKLW